MELEQIIKKIDWLDEERRKDKTQIARIEERLINLDGNLSATLKQLKEITGDFTRISANVARIDQVEDSQLQLRIENKKNLDDFEKIALKRGDEAEKARRVEAKAFESSLAELRKDIAVLGELKRNLQARVEEESRLSKLIEEIRERVDLVRRNEEEYVRTYRIIEDGRRQDAKRLTDINGEVATLRKRLDDQRGQVELANTSVRKVESRLSEISNMEVERRQILDKFLESQAMAQVDRERIWKEWQQRFDLVQSQTGDIETNLQALDSTHRVVKRSQQAVDELALKLERRINEITEMQKLNEERFRQEWGTFKTDDQKRWTDYSLTSEEQRSEIQRQNNRMADRVTNLEDNLQEIQDLLAQVNDLTGKRLQTLLAMTHEWVESYERTNNRNR